MRSMYMRLGLAGILGLACLVAVQPANAGVPVTSVDELENKNSALYKKDSTVAQVNSVSELTDVDPNSWAFQALKSVVERFGVIEGYPDKTFRGNRSLTRYEFAAGLNAALEKVNELITAGNADRVTKEDLATLQRLQEEFKTELAALRGRVDALEAKTKEIESKLFSTTAKLDAEVIFATSIQGADTNSTIFRDSTSSGSPLAGGSTNAVFLNRTRLNIRANSLITEGDQLRVRLGGSAGESAPFNVGRIDYVGGVGSSTTGLAAVSFDKVYYDFPVSLFGGTRNLRVRFGPQIENIDLIGRNKYTQNEGQNISFRNFRRDPLYVGIQTGNRPGGHIDLRFSNAFSLRAIYLAEDGGQAVGFGSGGIVGGSTQVAGELGIKPSPSIDIGLGYSYVNVSGSDTNFIFGNAGSDVTGGDGRLAYNPDLVSNISHSIFHGRLDWDIFPAFAIFGRYSFDTASLYGYSGGTPVGGSLDANTWMAGLALPDFLGKGNLLEAAYLQPINITNNGVVSTRVEQDAEGNNVRVQNEVFNPNISSTNLGVVYPRRSATESNIAVSYRFRVTDRLTVTPEVLFVLGANNINQNGITIGNLRATFEF